MDKAFLSIVIFLLSNKQF